MSEASVQSWIATLSPLLTPIGVYLSVWISYRNNRRLAAVHEQTNGMLKKLEVAAEARGNLAGVKEEVERQSDAAEAKR